LTAYFCQFAERPLAIWISKDGAQNFGLATRAQDWQQSCTNRRFHIMNDIAQLMKVIFLKRQLQAICDRPAWCTHKNSTIGR
jgi:hypothetical protein